MDKYNLEGQNLRRKIFNDEYIKKMKNVITDKAEYIGNDGNLRFREITWHTMGLLRSGNSNAKLANSILRNVETSKCSFTPMLFTQILKKYNSLLENDVKDKLKKYIIAHFKYISSDKIHISMYNDNFANMAIYTCLIAGEMFDDKALFEIGYKKLLEVSDYFTRCGVLMEYGSPTYTPINTLCFTEIVNHVKDEKVKKLALMCERRMFIEIATHYHPSTSLLAGPYSRAYAIDTTGHPHLLSGLLWLTLGEQVFINPIKYLFNPLANQTMHGGLEGLTLPNLVWLLDSNYHIDKDLIEIALNKKYPYNIECRTECIPSNVHKNPTDTNLHEYGGYRGTNTTYITENYSLGTAESQFHGGALSESFYITYKNRDIAKKLEDVGVIYSRYIFNDKLPEQSNTYEIFGEVSKLGRRDEGRKFCLQKKDEALVIYKPKHYEKENVKSAKLEIVIPCHYYNGFEIYVNHKKVNNYPHIENEMSNIYVLINKSYFAFRPLSFTNHGRKKAISIDKINNHIIISFYNYEGENRSFGLREMILTAAGFLAICKEKEEFNGLEEFIKYVEAGIIEDKMETQESAVSRKVKYINNGIELNFMYSPMTEGIYVDTVDKRPRGMHIYKANTIEKKDIPFL